MYRIFLKENYFIYVHKTNIGNCVARVVISKFDKTDRFWIENINTNSILKSAPVQLRHKW